MNYFQHVCGGQLGWRSWDYGEGRSALTFQRLPHSFTYCLNPRSLLLADIYSPLRQTQRLTAEMSLVNDEQ